METKNARPAHAISLTVANRPGVLVRVALVFSRRGFNIDSLVVSPSIDGDFSRMNIVAHGDPKDLGQIIAQLEKLVDVVSAKDHTGDDIVMRELALIKLLCAPEERTEILQLAQHFKASTVDMTESSMTLQVTGETEKIDAMTALCARYHMVEFIRTGKVIVTRGPEAT